MSCLTPIVIEREDPLTGLKVKDVVPCGKCEGCLKLQHSYWITRCMVENMYSKSSFFLTLTYKTQFLPFGVNKEDLQKFIKRLRHKVNLRYLACSEYGCQFGRPHYHLLIFLDEDLSIIEFSNMVSASWKLGKHCVGYVDISSITYCTKYILKEKLDPTGWYTGKTFGLMSRNPGIGYQFLMTDFTPYLDNNIFEISVLGHKFAMPRYYRDYIFDDEAKQLHRAQIQEKYKDKNQKVISRADRDYKRMSYSQKQKNM